MELWSTLAPLIVGSAVVPVQLAITLLLIRGAHGPRRATAWVSGRLAVTIAQGVLFGFIVRAPGATTDEAGSTSPIVSTLLLVVALLFFAGALTQLFGRADSDAAPPRWMRALDGVGPGRAFLLGAGTMVVGAKFWVFTLSAIAAIADEQIGPVPSTVTFLLFVLLSNITHLAIIVVAVCAPRRASVLLGALSGWLERHNRVLTITIGLVFGSWFALKAIQGFGIV